MAVFSDEEIGKKIDAALDDIYAAESDRELENAIKKAMESLERASERQLPPGVRDAIEYQRLELLKTSDRNRIDELEEKIDAATTEIYNAKDEDELEVAIKNAMESMERDREDLLPPGVRDAIDYQRLEFFKESQQNKINDIENKIDAANTEIYKAKDEKELEVAIKNAMEAMGKSSEDMLPPGVKYAIKEQRLALFIESQEGKTRDIESKIEKTVIAIGDAEDESQLEEAVKDALESFDVSEEEFLPTGVRFNIGEMRKHFTVKNLVEREQQRHQEQETLIIQAVEAIEKAETMDELNVVENKILQGFNCDNRDQLPTAVSDAIRQQIRNIALSQEM